MSPSKSK